MGLSKYAKDVGVETPSGADDTEAQSLILDAIRSMDDAKWDKLSDETKLWSNEFFEEEKSAKSESTEPKKPAAKKPAPKKKADDPLVKAKADARKKSAAAKKDVVGGKLFQAGSNSDDIYQIVRGAGDAGISLDDVIKAAEAKPIKSANIKARVKDILHMCAGMKNLSCSGLMQFKDDKYYVIIQDTRPEVKKVKDGKESASVALAVEAKGKEPVKGKKESAEVLGKESAEGKKVVGKGKSAPKKPAPKKPAAKKPAPKKPAPKKPAPKDAKE